MKKNVISRSKSIISSILVCIIGIIFYYLYVLPKQQYYYAHHIDIHGVYLVKPLPVKDFTLIDHLHKPFTQDNLNKQWSLMFFGFTNCGMVCPATMSALNKMYKILETAIPHDKLPQVVFISIDPLRDTPKRIREYVTAFNSHFIGVTPTQNQLMELQKQFHIIVQKTMADPRKPTSYNIDHSPDILLINPYRQIQAYFSYPYNANQLAADYKKIVSK